MVQMYKMYVLLNPHERHELENEMSREERILELHDELIGNNEEVNKFLIHLTF